LRTILQDHEDGDYRSLVLKNVKIGLKGHFMEGVAE
jgi:hypothetical protein